MMILMIQNSLIQETYKILIKGKKMKLTNINTKTLIQETLVYPKKNIKNTRNVGCLKL